MTWNIHYTIPFMSREGHSYTVNVYEWDYVGDIVTLTGASEPFVTQEDDDSDIFTPVRTQTGYIRVIDTTGGTLLEDMMPANNIERPVLLMEGGKIRWQGFLTAQAYSQPWDNHRNKISFAVASLLEALDSVDTPTSYVGRTLPLSQLLSDAIYKLGRGASSVFAIDEVLMSDLNDPVGMFDCTLDFGTFVDSEEIVNEGQTVERRAGQSYKECIESICALFGVSMREDGTTIYVSQYDEGDGLLRYGGRNTDLSTLATKNLLDVASFRDNDNSASYSQGAKTVKVSVALATQDTTFGIPAVDTSDDEPKVFESYSGKKLYVQDHAPSDSDGLTYTHHMYHVSTADGTCTYDGKIASSDFAQYTILHDYYSVTTPSRLATGGMPVRFFSQLADNSIISMVDGVLFNAQFQVHDSAKSITPSLDTCGMRPIMAFNSINSVNMANGYIRVDMSLVNVLRLTGIQELLASANNSSPYYVDDDFNEVYGMTTFITNKKCVAHLTVALMCDGKYWDAEGGGWTTAETTFELTFENGTLQSNYTDTMRLENTSGYFVPIAGVSAPITFVVYDRCIIDDTWSICYTHILYDLDVEYLANQNIVASSRSTNVYRRDLSGSGFSGTKSISLSVGTKNNNDPCGNLLLDPGTGDFINSLDYFDISGISAVRPEVRLLDRLAAYYSETRRTLQATLRSGLDLQTTRYLYRDRLYFGIDAQHNWREDTQEVKFIEAQAAIDMSSSVRVSLPITVAIPSIDSTSILQVAFHGQRRHLYENFDNTFFDVCDWAFFWSNADVNASFNVGDKIDVTFASTSPKASGVTGKAVCISKECIDVSESLYAYYFIKTNAS